MYIVIYIIAARYTSMLGASNSMTGSSPVVLFRLEIISENKTMSKIREDNTNFLPHTDYTCATATFM